MGATKRAPRNIPKEAGKTGRSTAGNRCKEEEECLSTEPTQTLRSQFPESAFHPTTVGHIPLWHQQPTQTWTTPLASAQDVFSGQSYILFIRGLIPQAKLRQNTPYSCKQDWAANDSTTELIGQCPHPIYCMLDLIQTYSFLICFLMDFKIPFVVLLPHSANLINAKSNAISCPEEEAVGVAI